MIHIFVDNYHSQIPFIPRYNYIEIHKNKSLYRLTCMLLKQMRIVNMIYIPNPVPIEYSKKWVGYYDWFQAIRYRFNGSLLPKYKMSIPLWKIPLCNDDTVSIQLNLRYIKHIIQKRDLIYYINYFELLSKIIPMIPDDILYHIIQYISYKT